MGTMQIAVFLVTLCAIQLTCVQGWWYRHSYTRNICHYAPRNPIPQINYHWALDPNAQTRKQICGCVTLHQCFDSCWRDGACWAAEWYPNNRYCPCTKIRCQQQSCEGARLVGRYHAITMRKVCPSVMTTPAPNAVTTAAPNLNPFTPGAAFPNPYTPPPGSFMYPGIRINGGTFNSATTLAACYEACIQQTNPDCKAIDFHTVHAGCYLHYDATDCTNPSPDRVNVHISTVQCPSGWGGGDVVPRWPLP